MDRIDVMRLFIRVADTGNFSKAARAAGISQPTVSKLIAGLEARLGAQLPRRTSRGLSLTDAGQSFYEGALVIVENVDQVESRVGKGDASPAGVVRVALSPAFGRIEIVPHLPQFFARYPDVGVEFTISQRYVNLIEEGIDVAIRVGPLSDSTLLAKRIGSTAYVTAASPAYLDVQACPRRPTISRTTSASHSCHAMHRAPAVSTSSRIRRPTLLLSMNSSRECFFNAAPRRTSAKPGAVQRRGIEIADAVIPGGVDGRLRLGLGDVAIHVAERRGSKAQHALQLVPDAHVESSIDDSESSTGCPGKSVQEMISRNYVPLGLKCWISVSFSISWWWPRRSGAYRVV